MFSTVQMAALTAILALGGTLALASSVFEPAPGPLPGAPAAATPEGAVHVTGDDAYPNVVTGYTAEKVDELTTQYRGGVITMPSTMDDPRVSGQVTFAFSVDIMGDAATEWGTLRLENEGGSWEGSCSGGGWDGGDGAIGNCWLTGSGDYEGFTYYRQHIWGTDGKVQGIIFPGVPPTDFPTLPAADPE